MNKIKSYIVGWDNEKEKIYVYADEVLATNNASHWTILEAGSAGEARELYWEKYINNKEIIE